MRYRFDRFEIDTRQFALTAAGEPVHVEPLVFDLIVFLVERVGQVVSRDAVIEQVWQGRFVSDATVSSCIKSARKALGDNGNSQTYIRTIRGRGFQFTASIESVPVLEPGARAPEIQLHVQPAMETAGTLARKDTGVGALSPPRIAVLPLFPLTQDPHLQLLGDALCQEVIIELSRLHWLFVIARGSSFKFRGQEIDLAEAGSILGAGYLLTGTILQQDRRCIVAVELCRARDNAVIWAERYATPLDGIMQMRSTLAGEIVGALEPRIQVSEALHAAALPTEHLDAWAAYHRGLWHMYRFNRTDNAIAGEHFRHALKLDPQFARAHAGLSFTHFQNAFLGFVPDAEAEKRQARQLATRSVELDPIDPFVNLTMGRSEWLSGDPEAGLPWIERSISLSPNYAFAVYNRALVGTLLGEGEDNEARIARAIALSPIDPLAYAMLATRAMTHILRGNYAEAAEWSVRAVRSPNAHVQIYAIAAMTHELVGRRAEAESYVAGLRRMQPGYRRADFLRYFPFRDEAARRELDGALARLGLT